MTFLSMKTDGSAQRIEIPRSSTSYEPGCTSSIHQGRALASRPNHVLLGASHAMWGPGKPCAPSDVAAFSSLPDNGVGKGVKLAVLDTGIAKHERFPASGPMPGREFDDPDEDLNRELDFEAGQRTFITRRGAALCTVRRRGQPQGAQHRRQRPGERLVFRPPTGSGSAPTPTSSTSRSPPLHLRQPGAPARARGLHRRCCSRRTPTSSWWQRPATAIRSPPFFPAAMKGVIGVSAGRRSANPAAASSSASGWWSLPSRDYARKFCGVTFPPRPALPPTPQRRSSGWASWAGPSSRLRCGGGRSRPGSQVEGDLPRAGRSRLFPRLFPAPRARGRAHQNEGLQPIVRRRGFAGVRCRRFGGGPLGVGDDGVASPRCG